MNENPRIRYGVWAAVSTAAQVGEDKFSIANQVSSSRERANSKGWVESAGPYIVPGESRSMWTSLSAAAEAIPSLGQLLEDGRNHKYDILIFLEYDRFRDLIDLVGMTLNHYGIQLYSVSQPSEPMQPDVYNPYASDSEPILRDVSKIASRIAINNMRRKYLENMPERVRSLGLHAISVPYGYKKPDVPDIDRKKAVLIQEPALVQRIIEMKDLLLSGKSLRQIRDYLEENKVPSPTGKPIWHSKVIRDLLTNPFYAGIVRFGASRVTHDLLNQREIRDRHPDPARIVTAVGRHQPVWDLDTYNAILAEFRKRPRNYSGQVSQRLTGLLSCHACGARLHMHYRQRKAIDSNAVNWRCSAGGVQHVSVPNDVMLERVISEVMRILDEPDQVEPHESEQTDKLIQLQARKQRLIDAYDNGLLDLADYAPRIRAVNADIAAVEQSTKSLAGIQADTRSRQHALETLRANRDNVPDQIRNDAQQGVNHLLRAIISQIIVDKDGTILKIETKNRV